MIPINSSGVGDYTDATSRIIVYESGADVTNQWSVALTYDSNNITVTSSTTTVANDTVAVTKIVQKSSTEEVAFYPTFIKEGEYWKLNSY